MKLTLICEHGTRCVEGEISYSGAHLETNLTAAASFVHRASPRCPYCEATWAPRFVVERTNQVAA